ncbi:helix-turn-helix domain-containing protein [Sphingomonas sp. 3-13AW]|uniref:helix-turn-helix domain-containing protein n=1 Tax=Sphingomonas sp. 3-13AW TaxID=3050450 RepID=UPI003BB787A3
MILGERVRERMEAAGLSQAELARRVGVAQPTIFKLIHSNKKGSVHLHRIARELGTTPAYLSGETDDPDQDAPPPVPPSPYQTINLQVLLPGEAALARMFEGLLRAMDRSLPLDEQALLLARRLPIGLSQLRDLLPAPMTAADPTPPEPRPKPVPEPQ